MEHRRHTLPPTMPKAESRSHTVHGATNFAALFGKEDEQNNPNSEPLQLPGLLGGRTLHFIRHCQGEHNATQAAGGTSQYLLDDAKLSSAGEAQARQLLSNPVFSTADGEPQLPELVVVSAGSGCDRPTSSTAAVVGRAPGDLLPGTGGGGRRRPPRFSRSGRCVAAAS